MGQGQGLGLWRLTRNRYGRRIYEALGRLGVTATRMYEYVADAGDPPSDRVAATEATLTVRGPDAGDRTGGRGHGDYADLAPDEWVVAARLDGAEVGHAFLSVDAERRVAPLERTLAFEGGYLRRLWVDPPARRRGIATALVARAVERAGTAGAGRVTALVAADNRPSRWTFEAVGFEPHRRHTYARAGPVSWRRTDEP
jgi:GNAT superfamily N-acetyltransferase